MSKNHTSSECSKRFSLPFPISDGLVCFPSSSAPLPSLLSHHLFLLLFLCLLNLHLHVSTLPQDLESRASLFCRLLQPRHPLVKDYQIPAKLPFTFIGCIKSLFSRQVNSYRIELLSPSLKIRYFEGHRDSLVLCVWVHISLLYMSSCMSYLRVWSWMGWRSMWREGGRMQSDLCRTILKSCSVVPLSLQEMLSSKPL